MRRAVCDRRGMDIVGMRLWRKHAPGLTDDVHSSRGAGRTAFTMLNVDRLKSEMYSLNCVQSRTVAPSASAAQLLSSDAFMNVTIDKEK